MAEGGKRWIPLESNPDPLNEYIRRLGVSENWNFVDVFGFDPELLAFVPQPVRAVVFLFPISALADYEEDEEDSIEMKVPSENDPWFVKQYIGNACGTIAVVHSLANNRHRISYSKEDNWLKKFLLASAIKSPHDRALVLDDSSELEEAHEECAEDGETSAPSEDERVDLHFIAFCEVNGVLYEFDGRRSQPKPHGPSSESTLLGDSVNVIKQFMGRDPESLRFSALALVEQ